MQNNFERPQLDEELADSYLAKSKGRRSANDSSLYKSERQEIEARAGRAEPPKQKSGGIGCGCGWIFRLGCLRCGCLILLLLALILFSVIFIFVQKPPALWEPMKSILNAGLNPPQLKSEEVKDPNAILLKAEEQLRAENKITLTQTELAILISSRTGRETFASINPNGLSIYLNSEPQDTTPLWIILTITKDNLGQLRINQVGTGLVTAPEFMTNFLTGIAQQILLGSQGSLITSLNSFIGAVRIKNVEFMEGSMTLETEINLQVNDLIPFL